eukprot:UN06012
MDFEFRDRHLVFDKVRVEILTVIRNIIGTDDYNNNSGTHYHKRWSDAYFQKSVSVPHMHDKNAKDTDDCWSLVCLKTEREKLGNR